MAYDYDRTHEDIQKSAAEHFLEKGFRGSSIRKICEDAGVTNGAFYAHFKSKEDLFGRLVEPAVSGLYDLYGTESGKFKEIHSAGDILSDFEKTFQSDEILVHYVYEHSDAFRLLLCAGAGTRYEDFVGQITRAEQQETEAFFEQCRPYIKKPENLSPVVMKRISAFVVTTVFDCFLAGKTEEETTRETQLASEFCLAGLKQIWGI